MRAPVKLITTTASLAAAAAALAGCGGQGGHHDCPSVAAAIAAQVDALRAAAPRAGQDPRDAATAVRKIQQDIDEIAGKEPDAAAAKAVSRLSQAVSGVKDELDKGEPVDMKPVTDASNALTSSCRKG